MPLVFVCLPIFLAFACYGEVRWRRIPNVLTGVGALVGLGAALAEGWLPGLWNACLGLLLGGGVLLPFCLLGVVGGGDMKLMAATGAIVGYPLILRVVTDVCLAGGLLAIAIMAWNGILLSTFANAFKILFGMPKPAKGLRKPPLVPYGLAIAAGTLYAVFFD